MAKRTPASSLNDQKELISSGESNMFTSTSALLICSCKPALAYRALPVSATTNTGNSAGLTGGAVGLPWERDLDQVAFG